MFFTFSLFHCDPPDKSSLFRQPSTSWNLLENFFGKYFVCSGNAFLAHALIFTSRVFCFVCFFSSSSSFCSLVFLIWATDSISWPGWWLSRQLMAPAQVKSQETFEFWESDLLYSAKSINVWKTSFNRQHTTTVKWKCCVSIAGLSCVGCLVCRCSLLPWKWINVTIVLKCTMSLLSVCSPSNV
jgi:hypothetical protein